MLNLSKLSNIKTQCLFAAIMLLLSSCATFDKTNILPGQAVKGYGFSFAVPTEKPWFAVVYGTSHRIKLRQLNDLDSYSILVSLNRGPRTGMYQSAEDHLAALKHHLFLDQGAKGLIQHRHTEAVDSRYGELCIRHTSFNEDWRGRNNAGPAMVETITLTCPHPGLDNVLISTEFSRRYETHANKVDVESLADQLFASFEFTAED